MRRNPAPPPLAPMIGGPGASPNHSHPHTWVIPGAGPVAVGSVLAVSGTACAAVRASAPAKARPRNAYLGLLRHNGLSRPAYNGSTVAFVLEVASLLANYPGTAPTRRAKLTCPLLTASGRAREGRRNPICSIGTMGGAVVAAVWARWCGGSARYGTQASADCRTDASTTPTVGDRADYGPSAGADKAATESALTGIVWVRRGRRRQEHSSTDHAGCSRLLSHSLRTDKLPGRRPRRRPTFG